MKSLSVLFNGLSSKLFLAAVEYKRLSVTLFYMLLEVITGNFNFV